MKRVFLGFALCLVANIIVNYAFFNVDRQPYHDAISFLKNQIFDGGYILDPLQGNCVDKMGKNGHGWTFNIADYYGCDRFQRMLNRNFKPRNFDSLRF